MADWVEDEFGSASLGDKRLTPRLIKLADREADIIALKQRAHALGIPAGCLIRDQRNWCLPDGGKLRAVTCAQDPLGEIEFTL